MASGDKIDPKQYPGMYITERNLDLPDEEIDQLDSSSKFRYKMKHKRRGNALIINNKTFLNGFPARDGTERDVMCMTEALDNLGFKVITRNNQSVDQMKTLFTDMKNIDHSDNDCFVAVILTHGEDDDVIFGTDNKVTLTELIEYLLPNNCPSLTGKPKLFFVQACRGSKLDKGTESHDAMSMKPVKKSKIPLWADVLISYSTVPGFFSWRNSLHGSWFIQSLGNVLKTHGRKREISELLTMVNSKVAYEYESKGAGALNRMKQMPNFSSMLTKQLYFS
nr:caspase 3 [Sepia esculenta]